MNKGEVMSNTDFTPRQIEVVQTIITSGCQKEACKSLFISKQTLKNELKYIKDKAKVSTIPQLVHVMTKRGII